jgi:hypothetical protein
MQISPVSNLNAISPSLAAPAPPSKSAGPAAPAADSVHLSAAAQAQLKTGDVDHDGDSR